MFEPTIQPSYKHQALIRSKVRRNRYWFASKYCENCKSAKFSNINFESPMKLFIEISIERFSYLHLISFTSANIRFISVNVFDFVLLLKSSKELCI